MYSKEVEYWTNLTFLDRVKLNQIKQKDKIEKLR